MQTQQLELLNMSTAYFLAHLAFARAYQDWIFKFLFFCLSPLAPLQHTYTPKNEREERADLMLNEVELVSDEPAPRT